MLGLSIGRTRVQEGQRFAWVPRSLLIALTLISASVNAATIVVDTEVDDVTVNGNCTLREAIIAANTNAAVDLCGAGEATPTIDRIDVPTGTYDLTVQNQPTTDDTAQEGDLDILEEVTIAGAGMNQTVIDGQGAERVFHVLAANTVLTSLQNLEIRNGNDDGGAGS